MTKWSGFRTRFPSLPEEPTYEDVKAALRDHFRLKPLQELANHRQIVQDVKDIHEAEVSADDVELTVLDSLIIDKLRDQDLTSCKTARGITLRIDTTIDAKIEEDGGRDKLRLWIEKNNMREVLSVHGQTLSALVRRRLDAGLDIPDGVEAVPRNALRITGRSNKGKD